MTVHRTTVVCKTIVCKTIAEAANLLKSGRLVAFPTETVYGLGADARNSRSVAGIFESKQRPTFDPLIVHVVDVASARELVTEFSPIAERLAAALARPVNPGACGRSNDGAGFNMFTPRQKLL